jgi:hypothetical protein
METDHQCIHCERSDDQAPLLNFIFRGETHWICAQCLPILIHKPHLLAGKLPGVQIDPSRDSE